MLEKSRQSNYCIAMGDQIRKQLAEYRTEALDSIAIAENRTKADTSKHGASYNSRLYLYIKEDNKSGFAQVHGSVRQLYSSPDWFVSFAVGRRAS